MLEKSGQGEMYRGFIDAIACLEQPLFFEYTGWPLVSAEDLFLAPPLTLKPTDYRICRWGPSEDFQMLEM